MVLLLVGFSAKQWAFPSFSGIGHECATLVIKHALPVMFQDTEGSAQKLIFNSLRLAQQRSYIMKFLTDTTFYEDSDTSEISPDFWDISSQHQVLTLEEAKDKVKGQFLIPPDELIAAQWQVRC